MLLAFFYPLERLCAPVIIFEDQVANTKENELWRTEGHFWIDDQDGNDLPGTLVVHADGAELRLLGSFHHPMDTMNASSAVRHKSINGTTEKYGNVCLMEPLLISHTISFGGLDRTIYSSKLLFASKAAHSLSEHPLSVLKLRVHGLDKWLGISGFTRPSSLERIEISYAVPDSITYALDDSYDLEWQFSAEGPSYTHPQTEVVIKQTTRLAILARKPVNFDEIFSVAQQVADFVRLAIGEGVESSLSEIRIAVPTTAPNGSWADAFLPNSFEPSTKVPHQSAMLFTYPEVESSFASLIKSWRKNASELSAVYQLYSATIRSSGMYTEHRLLNFFQAIESYHRIKYGKNLVISREACRQGKPISATERMQDLVTRLNCLWIFDGDDSNVDKVGKLRNYIVHRERKPPEEHLSAHFMYNAGSRCQLVCEIVLLSASGFNLDELNSLFQTKNRLPHLLIY